MSAHTPGPWTAEAVESGSKRRSLVYVRILASRAVGYASKTAGPPTDDGRVDIAGAYSERNGRYRGVTIDDEEALANGRLIAAAPDMLAALERIIRPFDLQWPDGGPPITHPQHDNYQAARAAIAKARGDK